MCYCRGPSGQYPCHMIRTEIPYGMLRIFTVFFGRIRHLRYVAGKEDEFLLYVFEEISYGKAIPTSQQEERLYRRYWGQLIRPGVWSVNGANPIDRMHK